MILHLLRSSPFTTLDIGQSLALMDQDDGLLLMQDAVYAIQGQGQSWFEQLQQRQGIYILKEDMQARGLSHCPGFIEQVDYSKFVTLTLTFDQVVTW
ncbi:sulfurtransferase complex subunit TusB [Bowmanella denitrificans]|uniref:Sulfurtransferase complex subunit TusB n=1 Tax=Bowmanella denitrificans TaxID=366582 RepID=A0ABP3GIR7_9ALTE